MTIVRSMLDGLLNGPAVIAKSTGDVFGPGSVYRAGSRQTGIARPDYTPLADRLYQLARGKGVKRARRYRGNKIEGRDGEFVGYREGDEILVSDELCKYELPEGENGLRALAFYAAHDPKLASTYLHELNEEPVGARVENQAEADAIHHEIQADAVADGVRVGYAEAAREALKLGDIFPWARISYDEIARRLVGGPSYSLYERQTGQYQRPTGQLQPIPPGTGVLTQPGGWLQLLADVERVALQFWQDVESDPADGLLSPIASEMKATGYGLSPVSKLRPPGPVFTIGPRQEPEYESVNMAQTTPLAGGGQMQVTRQWRQRRP